MVQASWSHVGCRDYLATSEDVLSMYKRITGEEQDMSINVDTTDRSVMQLIVNVMLWDYDNEFQQRLIASIMGTI